MRVAILDLTGHPLVKRRRKLIRSTLAGTEVEEFSLDELVKNSSGLRKFLYSFIQMIKLSFGRFDVVHILDHTMVQIPPFIWMINLSSRKLVFDIGDLKYQSHEDTQSRKFLTPFIKLSELFTLRLADETVARGLSLKEVLQSLIKNHEPHLIMDPVDVQAYQNNTKEKFRNGNGTPKCKVLIGYGGGMDWINVNGRNLIRGGELVEVLKSLINRGKNDFKIAFIGNGSALPDLKKSIEKAGLSDKCIVTGKLSEEDYRASICSVDVGFRESYDIPSYRINIGMKVQEYMAAGKMVVTDGNKDRRYLLERTQGNDLFFKPLSNVSEGGFREYVETIADIFERIYDSKDDLNDRIADGNVKRSLEIFDVNRIGGEFTKLYALLLSKMH